MSSKAEITPYLPKPNTSANTQLGLFGEDDFRRAIKVLGIPRKIEALA